MHKSECYREAGKALLQVSDGLDDILSFWTSKEASVLLTM